MSELDEPRAKKSKKTEEDEPRKDYTTGKETLIKETNKLQECLSTLLSDTKKHFETSIEEFFSDKVRRLSSAIGHYYNAFSAIGVLSREDMDKEIGKHYGDEAVVESVDKLMGLEQEWNSFLEDVDRQLVGGDGRREELKVGSPGPCELTITDVRTNRDFLIKDLLKSIGHSDLVLILLRHFA